MKLISHRGNINGPEPEQENRPDYINGALDVGYDVEIDVWKIDNEWLLGHDDPCYPVDIKFLMNPRLLCHAKNLEALDKMLIHTNIHCFWHQEDYYTITSLGYIVSYPGYPITNKTICMKPEIQTQPISVKDCHAICSDYVKRYR